MTRHARVAAAVVADPVADFAADVRHYLSLRPRQLPSRYLYDALGSALFDAICVLPWYPVTRAEMRLLDAHGHEVLSGADAPAEVVELGAGNGTKLAALLAAGRLTTAAPTVHLVDVSAAALATATRAITAATPAARVLTHELSYEDGLDELRDRPGRGRTLVVFLGSNIGNFDPPGAHGFLRHMRATLSPGDALLLGVDLVKPEAELRRAYDDPLGVTAAFNRNLLVRLNRELGATIDLAAFRHEARWNAAASRIEMHLVSTRPQHVSIPGAAFTMTLAAGETIWTESSYKYTVPAVDALLTACGFHVRQQWIDTPGRFALTLAGC